MCSAKKRRQRQRQYRFGADCIKDQALALAWFEAHKQWHGPHAILGMIKALKCYLL